MWDGLEGGNERRVWGVRFPDSTSRLSQNAGQVTDWGCENVDGLRFWWRLFFEVFGPLSNSKCRGSLRAPSVLKHSG